MKRIITSHAQFSLRYTNDRDVYLHHVVSRYGYYILMDKKFYESIYDCIVTGQVSSDRIAKYLKDKGFYKYWKKRKKGLDDST